MRRLPPLFALAALALWTASAAAAPTSIKASTTRGAAPLRVTLTAYGTALSFQWHLGDGTIAEGHIVQHTYQRAGEYRVVVKAIGLRPGRQSTAALTISVVGGTHGSSVLLIAILLALAVLLAVALAILVVRYRRRPTPEATPEPARPRQSRLEHALGELERALADGQVDQQRRALELLASELGESGQDGLAGAARELAWSRGSPARDDALAFARTVRQSVDRRPASDGERCDEQCHEQ